MFRSIELANHTLERAITDAFDSGIKVDDITAMVAQAERTYMNQIHGLEPDPERIFNELPEGLITVPALVKKHGANRSTIAQWIKRGKLLRYGRLKGSARGGGYSVVSEQAAMVLLNAPTDKGGRPRKRLNKL